MTLLYRNGIPLRGQKSADFVMPNTLANLSPHVVDYFGIWMIHGPTFESIAARCDGINVVAHLQSDAVRQDVASRDRKDYQVTTDGIAMFRVNGPTMKSVPSMADGTSTVRLRQQLRDARRDPSIVGGMLVMDTPGGTQKGNADLCAEVASFSSVKPLYAFVEDMTASAGVSVASQATKRFANNATAVYGAMGTYAVLCDSSAMAEKLGVKVHVIRAGEFKGMGEAGTVITDEHRAEMQRTVEALNADYVQMIANGLKLPASQIQSLADGKVILANDAVQLGLLNGIQTFEQTYTQLLAEVSPKRQSANTRNRVMEPATLAELKQTFPKSSAEWRETQLEKNATLSDAAIAYASHVEARSEAREKELSSQLDEANKKKAVENNNSLGHRSLAINPAADAYSSLTGDASHDFDVSVRARLPKGRAASFEERQAAIAYVARTNPQLHQAMLLQSNPGGRASRLIKEKYEPVGTN